jgi:light-regulated signal transduction histidine kinase (bacteriophytochrome)/CheY-like chemotaxis protein
MWELNQRSKLSQISGVNTNAFSLDYAISFYGRKHTSSAAVIFEIATRGLGLLSYDRASVDLTNCDKEPIHVPGSIQPHGAMLVLDSSSYNVSYVSSNIGQFLGVQLSDLLGQPLEAAVGSKLTHDIRNATAVAATGQKTAVVHRVDLGETKSPADILVHEFKGRLFLEFEAAASIDDTEIALHLTQSLVRRIDKETDVDSLARSVARLVRATLGYDRVMIYRFLHNGAGRVIAEAKTAVMPSFLGHHFPAGDIPAQARRLYIDNWVRVIGDSSFVPVQLTPGLSHGEAPVDMSYAHLRSVSPIHCEYLRNMGIAASMSISIVVDGELWGLVACHHDTPRALSIPLRMSAELFGQYLSLQISAIEHRKAKVASIATRKKLDAIISTIDTTEQVASTLGRKLGEFSSLIACDGAAVWIGGEWTATGVVPDRKEVEPLIALIAEKAGRKIWETQNLKMLLPASTAFGERVAGVLAIPVSPAADDYLCYFRSEEAHEMSWAGEPVKNETLTPSGVRLSPRGSFETWRDDVRNQSLPWTDADLIIAEAIRNYVRDVLISHNDATEEIRVRTDSERALLNAELNHRVKNILALVKSIAVQTGANASSVDEYASSFEGRLRALSYAHDQSFAGKNGGELRSLIEAEAGMHRFNSLPNRINLSGPSIGMSERAFGVFALLLHEMMTNAAKYGSLSVPAGRLDLSWALIENGDCVIDWRESGGPAVSAPTRTGFGTTLIQRTLSHDLDGKVELDFAPDGLKAHFVLPAAHLHELSQEPAVSTEVHLIDQPLAGLMVLLVEDQALIAMDTEELLKGLGASLVLVASTVDAALDQLSQTNPDCAVLDLNLGTETSERLAIVLQERKIPYVFATGYRDSVSIPEMFTHIPVVRKPVSHDSLSLRLSQALGQTNFSRYSEAVYDGIPPV